MHVFPQRRHAILAPPTSRSDSACSNNQGSIFRPPVVRAYCVTLQRDSQNAIAGVTLGGGRVAGIAFARKPGEFLQKSELGSDVPRTALAAVVGRYDYRGPVLAVTEEDGHVFAQLGLQRKFEIFPKSDHEFFWKVVNAGQR